MFNVSYEEIVSKIKEEKNLSDEEIEEKIKAKLTKLSDLISREGAAHIVANELGVKLFDITKELKIKGLLSGMNNVSITGKVVQVNPVVEFKKGNKDGKVGSFLIGDETGVVRAAFWDTNHIKFIENGDLKENTILKIKNAYVKSNNGFKELHVGNRGEIELNPSGVEIEVQDKPSLDFVKKKISELTAGESNVGVLGTIVQVFEPRFYEACPECYKKLESNEGKFSCKEHGKVSEVVVPIINLFFDDGTDNIRVVAFRNQAEILLNMNMERLREFREKPETFSNVRDQLLGKQLVIVGRVTKNEMFDRKEFMAQRIIDIEPEELIKDLEND